MTTTIMSMTMIMTMPMTGTITSMARFTPARRWRR